MSRPARGRFVVLEGLDGAGTTTQAQRLADALRARGVEVELTHEPTSGPLGAVARQAIEGRLALDPVALALAFAADRADHVANPVNGIAAHLAAGRWVVSDRYVLSSLAYNRSDALTREWIAQINAHALAPDLTIFLDVDPETCLARIAGRSAADELFHSRERLVAVDRGYREAIAGGLVRGQLAVVPGAAAVEQVAREVWEVVAGTLGLPAGAA